MNTTLKDFSSLNRNRGEETLTPDEYLQLFQKHPEQIQSVEIIPPKIGSRGFGKFKVTYKNKSFRLKNGK